MLVHAQRQPDLVKQRSRAAEGDPGADDGHLHRQVLRFLSAIVIVQVPAPTDVTVNCANTPNRPFYLLARSLLAGLVVILSELDGSPAWAQSSVQPTAVSDSRDLLRRAHQAQRDFERTRRAHLPAQLGAPRHTCDERIGRYCYWYDLSPDSVPPESHIVQRARERLLRDLAAAGEQLPGNGWITGQLVRYLAESGRADSAVIIAQQCRATRWWCEALEGFALHLAHDYEDADEAFGRALRGMPEKQRCEWTDLTALLEDGDRAYRALSCAERQSVGERIWWLSRPLYSRPGNDLRTEHYARHVMALLLEDAETPDGVAWGADRSELVVRFGWPTHWSRSFEQGAGLDPPPILGHEPGPSFWLFPAPSLTEPWADATEVHWDPDAEHAPARYAPPYAAGFAPIDRVQFARFRWGDSTLTIAAFDLTPDSVFSTRPADIRLAVARDPTTPVVIERASLAASRGVLSVRSPWRPSVLSLEAVGLDTSRVARRRALTGPDPVGLSPAVSDILLFTPGDVLPLSLDAALATALDAPMVQPGQRVGLYWEMYDQPDSTTTVEIAVTAMKTGSKGDPIYPVGRPRCPFTAESPVRLRWREQPGSRPRGAGRSVTLDLRSLSPGRYVIALQATAAGRPLGCSSREVRLAVTAARP
jgi:hypothetical protein